MDTVNSFCLKEIKSFDDLEIGDNLYLSLNSDEFKEYKITKIQQNKPIETDPEMPITMSYPSRDSINYSYGFDERLFSKDKKVNNKPFYSKFSKHYSHK